MTKCFTTLEVERYKLGTLWFICQIRIRRKFRYKAKNIKKIKVKKKINTRKMFDIWSSIALEWEIIFENINFVEMNKPWVSIIPKLQDIYNKFIKDFRGGNNWKTFEKKLFDLLDEAKNKSIQDTKIERKFPFKQSIPR